MTDILAIVSKAVFEADAPGAAPGAVLPLDRYHSKNPGLGGLAGGGRLFLVTVRPPDEQLWLVAVLDQPKHDGTSWVASKPNGVPITDVSAARGKLRFATNTGITAKPGALGMSLQTPRTLTADDAALLLGGKAAKAASPAAAPKAAAPPPPAKKAPPAPAGGWEKIADALKHGRPAQALPLLLARWEAGRAPAVAALIDQVAAQLPVPTGAFAAQVKQAPTTHLGPVLDALTEGVRFAEALTRIQALARLAPDPRVAARLTGFLLAPPFTAQSSRDFWNALFDQLAGPQADPRTIAALRPVADRYDEVFGGTKMGEAIGKRVTRLLADLTQRFAEVPVDEVPPAVGALLPKETAAPRAPAKDSEEGLLAAIYAAPKDDGPRQIYADWLLERGDPRGEFITLQFRRARGETLTPAEEKQEKALLKKHHAQWQGPLRDITYADQDVFERGFLSECRLRLLGGKVRAALNHPAWATVKTIHLAVGGTKEHGANLLVQPAMRHLEELDNAPYDVVRALGEEATEHALERLSVGWMLYQPAKGAEAEKLFVAADWDPLLTAKTLKRLKVLKLQGAEHLSSATLASFWGSPRAAGLERLVLTAQYSLEPTLFADARSRAPRTLTVEFELAGHSLSFGRSGPGRLWPTEVSRGKSADWAFGELLARLPRSFDVPLKTEGLTADQRARLGQHLPKAELS